RLPLKKLLKLRRRVDDRLSVALVSRDVRLRHSVIATRLFLRKPGIRNAEQTPEIRAKLRDGVRILSDALNKMIECRKRVLVPELHPTAGGFELSLVHVLCPRVLRFDFLTRLLA